MSEKSVKSLLAGLMIKLVNFGLCYLFNRFDIEVDFNSVGCPYCSFFEDEVIE